MASWESARHVIGARTFVVLDHTSDQIVVNGISSGVSQQWRTVQDAVTGEVVREFKAPPECYSPSSYDFDEGHRWLTSKFGPTYGTNFSPNVAGAIYTTSSNNISISSGTTTFIQKSDHAHASPPNVPAATATGQAQDEDNDMLRDQFTFPYTGDEIAAALSAKITALTDSITALHSLDELALSLLYNTETDTTAKHTAERRIKELQRKVDALVAERAPYAKASKQKFDLDLEDVTHFGLNAADAPRKATRKRAAKPSQPVEDAA